MTYSIEYHISALFVTLFIVFDFFLRKDMRKTINKGFMFLVLSHLTSTLFVIGTTISNNNIGAYSLGFRDFVNHGFLISHNSSAYVFALYTMFLMGYNKKRTPGYFAAFTVPLAVTLFLLLLNPWQRWVFYYDQGGIYSHGKAIYVLYLNALFYLLYSAAITIRLRKTLSKSKFFALLIFLGVSTVPVVIQMLFPHINIEIFLQSLGILGVLWTIENKAEVFNTITQIYNRFAFVQDATLSLNNKVPFEIITIKLSDVSYFISTLGLDHMQSVTVEMAAWFNGLAHQVDAYDCEKGHFCLVNFSNSAVSSEELISIIKKRFSQEWICADTHVTFPVEISMLGVPQQVDSIEQIMLLVDMPYRSRQFTAEVISTDILSLHQREIKVTQAIEEALKEQAFSVYYQPIWDRQAKRFTQAEALIRLFHDDMGPIPPDEFIPIAERNGSIIGIGDFVFTQVCSLLQKNDLKKQGISSVAINLSVVQCMNQRLVENFEKAIDYYKVDPANIKLEITESVTADNPAVLLSTMEKLQALGFTFALDDYGTGYSNVSHILNMPFQIIKLDKSIIWGAVQSTSAEIMLKSTIAMMREMGLKTVAEGVETQEQKELLTFLECDYLQGYFLAQPMNQEDFLDYCGKYSNIRLS
ncbi:MAG: EAL domain-containing protein [Firmicutes bacterium]|nr:EAL domain-containing protein [Bacillota bacterium]